MWQVVEQSISGWQFMCLSGRQCEGQCPAMSIRRYADLGAKAST